MSRKKEVALQDIITNDDEWDTFVGSAAGLLTVVDAYPKWTGPCKSICSTLKRIKLEAGSQILKFATACVDDIQDLESYRNQPPEPTFLFFASGVLVDVCHGCDVPLLTKKINDQIKNEEQIAAGMAIERKPYTEESARPASSKSSVKPENPNEDLENSVSDVQTGQSKQLCFVFVTPQYIEFADEIKEFLKTQGVEILEDRQHLISENEIKTIYPDVLEQDSGQAFVDYVTGQFDSDNPGQNHCHLMILTRTGDTGIGIIDQMQKLVGPGSQEQAQQEAPDSINAKYGNMTMFTSADTEMTERAVELLFPEFSKPLMSKRASELVMNQGTNQYLIFGENSEDFQSQIQNYGCKIVGESVSFENLAEALKEKVGEDWKGHECMIIDCSRSFNTLQNFCEGITEKNLFIAKC